MCSACPSGRHGTQKHEPHSCNYTSKRIANLSNCCTSALPPSVSTRHSAKLRIRACLCKLQVYKSVLYLHGYKYIKHVYRIYVLKHIHDYCYYCYYCNKMELEFVAKTFSSTAIWNTTDWDIHTTLRDLVGDSVLSGVSETLGRIPTAPERTQGALCQTTEPRLLF